MQPDNESIVYSMAEELARNLQDGQTIQAYPLLQPILVRLGHDVMTTFSHLLGLQRQELFYGESPWAKLYRLQTGRDIRIPDRSIVKNVYPDAFTITGEQPWQEIFQYFMAQWKNPEGHGEWIFDFDGPEGYFNQVKLNLKTQEATYHWANNDMHMTLPNFFQNCATLMCPLFDKPYEVSLEFGFIQRTLLDKLLDRMLSVWGTTDKGPADTKLLVNNLYYGPGEGTAAPDTTAVKRLKDILTDNPLGKTYGRVEWNGCVVHFSTIRDYTLPISTIVTCSLSTISNDIPATEKQIRNWGHNPLLVADLRQNMTAIINKFLDQYDLQIKEQA